MVNKQLYKGLKRYFTHLRQFGYAKQTDVNTLILLMFISEFLEEYEGYLTDCDLNKINDILACLVGKSCMYIPSEKAHKLDFAGSGEGYNPQRFNPEDYVTRITEVEEDMRAANKTNYIRVALLN